MPKKGWRKPVALTAEDYGTSAELVSSAAITLSVVAKKHPQMAILLAAITLVNQTSDELYAQRGQIDQRPSSSVVPLPQDADRSAEERS